MHLDSFLYRMGPSMYLKTLQAAETAHCLTHNRTYTDNVEDLVAGKQSRNGLSDGLKLGYQIKLTVTDGGRHYAAVVRCGLCGVDRRNEYWYYTDDTGVVCMAPAGTEPTKDSDKMF